MLHHWNPAQVRMNTVDQEIFLSRASGTLSDRGQAILTDRPDYVMSDQWRRRTLIEPKLSSAELRDLAEKTIDQAKKASECFSMPPANR